MKMKAPVGRRVEFDLGPWDGGVDEKTEPGNLAGNFLHAAENVLLDEVPGVVTKKWGNSKAAAMPGGGKPKFAYEFKKNDGSSYMLLSDGVVIYATEDMVDFGDPLVENLDPTAYLQFETADDKCWIMNGTDFTMWFDGKDFEIMDREWGTATPTTTKTGTSATQIVDATLPNDPNDATNDLYWVNRRVVITSGTYAGMEGLVTAFNHTTHTLTITGFDNNPGSGVGYMVGLIMLKGKICRAKGATLFIGATTENGSEVRFNRLDDPDTGIKMHLDNPRAWPASYQLAITQDDGDHVWTFSPCYRDRVLVTKGTAIYRLEPDATFVFVPVLVSQEVGCRYPDSWAVKDELLHFLGSERSGLLDLYVTDMVSVRPRNKEGFLVPSFQTMFRSEKSFKYRSRASADDFNTGERSTFCETKNGRLESRVVETKSDWDEVIAGSESNAHASEASDSVVIDGIPAWSVKYECNVLPENANPAWTKRAGNHQDTDITTTPGKLVIKTGDGNGNGGYINYWQPGFCASLKNAFATARMKQLYAGGFLDTVFKLMNGTIQINVVISNGRIYINRINGIVNNKLYPGTDIGAYTQETYEIFHLLLDKTGHGAIYRNGVQVWTGVPDVPAVGYHADDPVNILNSISFSGSQPGGVNGSLKFVDKHTFDFVYTDSDFELTCAELPATLPTTGSVTVKVDYTRTPEAFNKVCLKFGHEYEGAVTTAGNADSTSSWNYDTNLTGEDNFWVGRRVVSYPNGEELDNGTVIAYDSATHKLTVDKVNGFVGPVGQTYAILRAGTVTMTTQSSADDVTYEAPVALANWDEPGGTKARYLKINITLTRADVVNGPEVAGIMAGFLWRMKAVQVGANISAWRSFLAEITTPSSAALVASIRLATVATNPKENEWGAWHPIVTLDNIGTILSDTPPPAAGQGRWLDVKVEGGPIHWGIGGYLENFTLNWQEGGVAEEGPGLVVAAFMYKKRFYLTGLSAVAAANDILFVLDNRKAWTKFSGQRINRMVAFNGIVYGLSSVDDSIYQMEVEGNYNEAGAPIVAFIQTGAMDFGHTRFELQTVKVGNVGITSSVEVFTSYYGDTWVSLGTLNFTGDGTGILRAPRGRIGKQHFIKLVGAGAEGFAVNLLKVAGVALPEER